MPELVAIDMAQGPALVELLDAIWARGDAACVVDVRLTGDARAAQLRALAPTRRIGPDHAEVALQGGIGVEPGDALVVATSGSTGGPRACVLTHDAVEASARATSARLAVDAAADRWLCCLPCAHIGGLAVVTRAMLTGTAVEVHPRFDPPLVERAAREGATLVSLVASALGRVDAAWFRTVVVGGAAPPVTMPPNAVVTWGMTETGSGVVYDGVPLDGVEVAEHEGELFVRGAMVARAYRDGESIDAIGPDGTRGWLATGDAGGVHDGKVTVLGRIDDVINTGGEKVWPADVERVLARHPGIEEVAVWRRDDPQWGQRVVAWVVPTGDAPSLESLAASVADEVAPWAVPKELVVVHELPRLASGKVARRLLT